MARKNPIDPIDAHVGQRLRLGRNLRDMSQEQLAALEGLTFQQIQKYELGVNRMGSSRLVHFALHLRFPISFFYQGLDAPLSDNQSDLLADLPDSELLKMRETHRLLGLYYAVDNRKKRKTVLNILQSAIELMQ